MWNPFKKPPAPPAPTQMVSGTMELFGYPAWLVFFLGLCALHMLGFIAARSPALKGSALSKDPHLAGHFPAQLLGFIILAYLGAGAWLLEMPEQEVPIDSYLPVGERIACYMLAFQMYELAACIPAKRLRGLMYEMVGHHCITLLLSVLAYKYQAFQYWAPCFMGMAEISSVPLALVDFFKQFPTLKAQYPVTNELARNLFAALFLPIRGCYWPYSSIWFWKTALATLETGGVIYSTGIIYTFCVCNVLMTMLQWYWASLIIKAVYMIAKGDPRHKEA